MRLGPLVCVVLTLVASGAAQVVEEYYVHGPMDLHQTAMNAFLEVRRKDPTASLTGTDSEFMKKANEYAVKRMRRRPEDELALRVSTTRHYILVLRPPLTSTNLL